MKRSAHPLIAALTLCALVFPCVALASDADSSTNEASDSAALMTPESAFETLSAQEELDDSVVDEADRVIERALRQSPKNGRWVMAQSMITARRGDTDAAYDIAKKAIELTPNDAMLHYLFGNAAFAHINNVSFINKGAVASRGRKAYERAVELDPTLMEAHFGLASYYTFAPGIAGGSIKKAREIVDHVRRLEGGAHQAALLEMMIESKERNWDAYRRAARAAVETAANEEEAQDARMQSAALLIFQAERHDEALPIIREIQTTGNGEYRPATVSYFEGLCLKETGDLTGAIESLERTLMINPDARNTRFLLAECYEELDQSANAAKHYAEYAERFSDDDKAKAARKKARQLEKRASS